MSPGSVTRTALLAILVGLGPTAALAHDFWVQPREFWLSPDSVASMTLQVGHVAKDRMVKLDGVRAPCKTVDRV